LSFIPNINAIEPISFNVSRDDNFIKLKISEKYEAHFSSKSGLLNQLASIDSKNILKSRISVIKYGTTSASEKSGAYLFLPDGKATELASDLTQWIRVEQGLLRTRVCVNMTLLLHCVEFYPTLNQGLDLKYPHFSIWNVIDLRSSHNTEIALHIDTDIKNKDNLYTDLNGFQFIKRKTLSKLPIQGNVFPMPTASFIQDESLRFNLLTAQPLGVASLEQSAIQVFLDRRLDQDDNRGMEQAMNDNILTSSRFIMFFESIEKSNQFDHPSLILQLLSYDMLNPILKLISEKINSDNVDSVLSNRRFLKKHPCDLRLVNLRTMQTPNEEPIPNEVGLILHRIVYDDCQHGSQINNVCNLENKILSFEDLFNFVNKNDNIDISNTYLTFSAKDSSKVQQKEPIIKYVQPMQIEAFRVKFQN
jgi:alpha-mannosidase II